MPLVTALVLLFAAKPDSVPKRAIRHFGGKVVNARSYQETRAGFAQYLRDGGIRRISAEQLTTPNHPEIAQKYGYGAFLPTRVWWARGLALALVAEKIQDLMRQPVRIRNWWRPGDYNLDEGVGGKPRSDHVTAHALDLDYPSPASCARAIRWLRILARKHPWLRLSLGTGPTVTHVGIDSPIGAREWRYE
jgi:hypothetical protein